MSSSSREIALRRGDGFLALGLAVGLVALEQGITLELGLDEDLELEIAELEQLDRLLQLRRDDQGLALPQFQTCTERHPAPPIGPLLA